MEPTIIRLGNDPSKEQSVTVATFEEAFGEHSEFRGRGRARRQARRLDRKKKRQERRMTKLRNRQERKRLKQEMRDERVQSRLARKAARKASRHGGDDVDDSAEQDNNAPDSGASDNLSSNDSQSQENTSTGYEDTSTDNSSQDDSSEDSAQDDSDSGSDEGGSSEDEGGDEGDSGFDGNYNGGAEDSYNSDLVGAEDQYSAFAAEAGMTGKPIDPRIREITNKIVWNEEMLTRLRKKYKDEPESRPATREKIHKVAARLKSLEARLSVYKKHPEKALEVGAGKHFAKRKLSEHTGRHVGEMKHEGVKPTVVEKNLHASISKNKIEVPGKKSSANGTGLNGLDNQNDFDAPRTRVIELTSNADGATSDSSKHVKAIVIGVGLGALAIYAIHKYKLFGK